MKQIRKQKENLLLKLMVLISVMLCTLIMQGMISCAAAEQTLQTTADYSAKAIEETTSSCKIIFTPVNSMDTVDIHYKVNNGDQQNLGMTKNESDWSYTINGLNKGDSIELSFTYITSGVGHNSESVTYVMGTATETGDSGNGSNTGNDDSGNNDNTASSIRIEAESYTSMSGVTKESTQISGLDTNDWMRYQTNVTEAGKYYIVAHGKANGTSDGIIVFRDNKNRIATVKLTKGGTDFSDYKSDAIELPAGSLQLTAIVVSGGITADWFELEPVKSSDNGSGGNDDSGNGNNNSGGSNDDNYVDPGIETTPIEDTTIPEQSDKMILQFNNVTNGAYSDDEIYWCAIGYDPANGELCYVDAAGNLNKATTDLNTIDLGNGRKGAQIYNTIAENKYIYMPSITSGRMYISYGKPVYIEINVAADGRIGFAGPDMNNPTDPNANTYFEFMEFTVGLYGGAVDEPTHYWGNTTRVDNFCFPVVTRLIGENRTYDGSGNVVSSTPYDKTVGDLGGRDYLFNEFISNAPTEFQSGLTDTYRIFAPCKKTFNEGKTYGSFYDSTIDAFWEKYSKEDFVLECQGGAFRARVNGDVLEFTEERSNLTGRIDKPTTQDVLEGKGAFDRNTSGGEAGSLELVLEAQLCAAFNRGLALSPTTDWYTIDKYYQNYPYNYYAKFWHEHSINNLAYGFCYDDVNDQSTLLECNTAKKLVIDLKWN